MKNIKQGKELNFKEDHFIANGVKYYYYGDISKFGINRFRHWQNLEPMITFNKTFTGIHKDLSTIIKLINDSKQVEAHKLLFDLWECIGKGLNDRIDPVLEGCTLFMITEDEDLTAFDEIKARKKIKDWEKEGISYQSFFTYVTNIIPNYIARCLEISQQSSTEKKKKKSQSTNKE